MKKVRVRVVGAVAVLAAVGALLVATTRDVSAAVTVYSCVGRTDDIAAIQPSAGWWDPVDYYTTDGLMSSIAGTVNQIAGQNFPRFPQLPIDIAGNNPDAAATGSTFASSFSVNATLPQDLINSATSILGMTETKVKNTTFRVNATNTSPSFISGSLPDQIVPMAYGQPTSVNASASGNFTVTGASGGLVLYQPGQAHVELDYTYRPEGGYYVGSVLINGVWISLNLFIYTLRFDCTPVTSTLIDITAINGGSATTTTTAPPPTTTTTTTTAPPPTTTTTTTTAPPPTTTTTTTTAPPPTTTTTTTTAPPPTTTTTTTTAPPPTTTTTTTTAPPPTTTTTTTTAPPPTTTTTAPPPTTTTTVPSGGGDAVDVTISGYGYQNAGSTTGGFTIVSNSSGVQAVGGLGSLPGVNGGTASVVVNMTRNMYWSFGSVGVQDAGAGIALTGYRAFGQPMVRFGNSVTVSGSWFTFNWKTGFKPYTITATVTDNG